MQQVHGKVVIDQASGVAHIQNRHDDWRMDFNESVIDSENLGDRRENFESVPCGVDRCNICTDISNDFYVEYTRRAEYVKGNDLLQCCKAHELTDDHFLLLPLRVYGYELQDRKWHALYVDQVEDIVPLPHNAFNGLVLEDSHKKLIEALVKNQTRDALQNTNGDGHVLGSSNKHVMDLVPGKGRGLIVLLHGVPGKLIDTRKEARRLMMFRRGQDQHSRVCRSAIGQSLISHHVWRSRYRSGEGRRPTRRVL